MFIVTHGNLDGGFGFTGPFESEEKANEWIKKVKKVETHNAELFYPVILESPDQTKKWMDDLKYNTPELHKFLNDPVILESLIE